jgi:hypothetical protein
MRKADWWTTVRVSVDTKEQLEELRDLFTEQAHRTKEPIGSDYTRSGEESKRDVIGLDQVIRKLIRYHKDHAKRAAKSSAKRRKPPQGESNQ